ncbi:beta-N-acetylglucosaminidase [Sinobacterium caligoides]|uniref:Beta-N-acetylglucosaminidase n=1 Tax=Sinobacterium caligoides TaxID=933926 RepID=A0A3N2DK18_9GAMM|nr:beta-N-acetylglucosaminidase domain-containing protein [Sinobacterium caligoides]ROS00029.1 beta-N-acetylglucosaminidase [Sinobacterium caligoides]
MAFNDKITGVIEGFYGRPWSWQYRQRYARFLAHQGFNTYIYAPKSDPWLRKLWREPWPNSQLTALKSLRQAYRKQGVRFGLGFSPFELYCRFDQPSKDLLDDKLRQIDQLSPDVFCILFDDMRGDVPGLAARQREIIEYIAGRTTASKLIVCPTYYSDDVVLEKVFGAMPANYLEDFAVGLDRSIEVFWTGERVCSEEYSSQHLLDVERRLGRKPLIWDNYPVNDGRITSNFLHIDSPENRDCLEYTAGLLANPMNQAALSALPLSGLAKQLFGAGKVHTAESWQPSLALQKFLMDNIKVFQVEGLSSLDKRNKQLLLKTMMALDEPGVEEVKEWLNGQYVFDPACLTE